MYRCASGPSDEALHTLKDGVLAIANYGDLATADERLFEVLHQPTGNGTHATSGCIRCMKKHQHRLVLERNHASTNL